MSASLDARRCSDLAGDGRPDLVVLDGPMPGLYEHDDAEGWGPFRPFSAGLNRNSDDPDLRFVDLDGDGHADVLITEDDAFAWYPSLAEAGLRPGSPGRRSRPTRRTARARSSPSPIAVGPSRRHVSGDGLTDLVRIRNGEVCYWPNLGYGRFGAKVTMDNAPLFDHPDAFDPDAHPAGRHRRLRHHRPHLPATATGSGSTSTSPATAGAAPANCERSRGRRPRRGQRRRTCSATAPPAWSGPRRCPATRAASCATST